MLGTDLLAADWAAVRQVREAVTEAIEPHRRAKAIRSSLEAEVDLHLAPEIAVKVQPVDMQEICITSTVRYAEPLPDTLATVVPTSNHKCGRCWRHLVEVAVDGALCDRCAEVLAE
jgi:isoleucyl-tRNA synthetase